jgi:hypothetical protein
MAETVNITVFRNVTPCISEADRCFVGTYRLHLQDLKVNQARNCQNQERTVILSFYVSNIYIFTINIKVEISDVKFCLGLILLWLPQVPAMKTKAGFGC